MSRRRRNAVPRTPDDLTWPVLDALIGQIYESALDPALWGDTLMRITTSLGPLEWDLAFRIWETSQPATARFVGSTGLAIGGGGGEARTLEISRMAAWFGLTPAEARLASALGAGASLQACSARHRCRVRGRSWR